MESEIDRSVYSEEPREKALHFLRFESGINPIWHDSILFFMPTEYRAFVDFYSKNRLELNSLMWDLKYISMSTTYPESTSRKEIQRRRLNILKEYYEANNYFRDEKPSSQGITVFHDEVDSLIVKMKNGINFEIKNLDSNLQGTTWIGLKSDFIDE
ncbi:hypothetical protein [Algoriphagus formosus]|uniref:hypothetical protein n=1 Tax=Algoriphagus formosus TaxID=2007308 RepID=UPI003F703ADB